MDRNYLLYLSGIITENQYYDILENIQGFPILFAGDMSAVLPSNHNEAIKMPDGKTKEKLIPIAQKGVWFEGVGEHKQGGNHEASWVKNNLGVQPKSVRSFDQDNGTGKTIYSQCGGGIAPAVILFSNVDVNKSTLINIVNNTQGETVRDAIKYGLSQDSTGEGIVPESKIDEFLKICEQDGLDLNLPKYQLIEVAKNGESKMWAGHGANMNTALGKLADYVEKERRSIIVKMMKTPSTSGIYFLGSGHLPDMQKEHPDLIPDSNIQ